MGAVGDLGAGGLHNLGAVGEWRRGGKKKKGPRRGLKGPDLGVESDHAEVWRLGVK